MALVVRDGARAERRVSGKGGIQGSVGVEPMACGKPARITRFAMTTGLLDKKSNNNDNK